MATPFDPDAYLAERGAPQVAFDPDGYLEVASQRGGPMPRGGGPQSGRHYVTQAERIRQARGGVVPSDATFDPKGLLVLPDMAASAVLGIPAELAGFATQVGGRLLQNISPGIDPKAARESVTEALTFYHPSRNTSEAVGALAAPIAEKVVPFLERHPIAATGAEVLGLGLEATGVGLAAKKLLSPRIRPDAPVSDPQSMGAAASAVDTSKLTTPGLRQAIEEAQAQGALDRTVVERHIDADTLPVPVRLTKGQATQSPDEISRELLLRGKSPERSAFYQQQNQALFENIDEIRAEVGPDVVHRDSLQNGQAMVDAYKNMDAPVRADIDAKYKALRDAAGGDFPLDVQGLLDNVRVALKAEHSTSKAPSDVMSALTEAAATGSMSLEQFEGMRTALARIQRSASDGQERYAAGVIREQIEKLPMQESSAELKALADTARRASAARFSNLKADPAYRAAVEDGVEVGELSPESDGFVRKFIVNGKGANLKRMRENLAGDEEAARTIAVSALNYLKEGAEGRAKTGNFSQAGYNSALNHLSPRLEFLMPEETAELAQKLGRVANYTQFQPRGSWVNNSNTATAQIAEGAKNTIEGIANNKLLGIPAGTFVRKKLEGRAAEKEWLKATEPGAGVRLNKILNGEPVE